MIHLALFVAAFLFLCWVGLAVLGMLGGLVSTGFAQNKGCGCLALLFSAGVVAVILLALLVHIT